MIDIVIVLVSIFLINLIGYLFIKVFGLVNKSDYLTTLSYSYGLGVGLVALQLYIYSRFEISWTSQFILFPWLFFLIFFVIKNKPRLNILNGYKIKLNKDHIFIFILLFIFAFVFFEAIIRPVMVWDAVANWLFKAKVFFIDGSIRSDVVNSDAGYPLIINLLGTFVYIMLGHVNDSAVLLTSVAFFTSTALLLYTAIRRISNSSYSLIITFLFVATQNVIRHGGRIQSGQADLPLGYFSLICMILLLDYLKKSSPKTLMLLSLFLGLTSLIKVEGLPIALIIGIISIFHILKYKFYKHIYILLIWLILVLDWQIFSKIINRSENYFAVHPLVLNYPKTINAIVGTLKEFFNIRSWNLLWIMYGYSFAIFSNRKNSTNIVLNIVILSQIVLYIGIFIFTFNSPESTIERLLMHIAPIVFYYLSINSWPILKKYIVKST